MSHFTLLVCLDKDVDLSIDEEGSRPGLNFALDQALERFSENREVEPYRDYLNGGPADFWWVEAARRERDHYTNGTGLKKYEPGMIGWSSASSKLTHDQQRAEQLGWKKWADLLDAYESEFKELSWLKVIELYDAWKRRTNDHSEDIFYDEETNQAYALNTYNPDSRWDWWQVGGRWAGKFHVTERFQMEDVLFAELGRWNSPKYDSTDGRINGGRVRYVDLERARGDAASLAITRHRRYHAIRAEHGADFKSWEHYVGLAEAEKITDGEARALYNAQPLQQALHADKEFNFWWGDLHGEMSVSEEEYAELARRGAVTCYSLLTKAGIWMEPGQMHMFGMSTDTDSSREAYDVEANVYIDNLDPDDIIVVVDCHI